MVAYGFSRTYVVPLVLVFFHGVFWSGLLSSSSAYMTDFIPEGRRAEGIGYWGMSTMLAVAVAPSVGFWMYHRGWGWLCAEAAVLNLGMAAIAFTLDEGRVATRRTREKFFTHDLVEWRVVVVSFALFLCSFGYGGVTSFVAVYAERNGISPKGIFFTTFAMVVLVTRVFSGRLADRIGHRRFFLPCLGLVTVALALLALARTRTLLVLAAVVFGVGFGNMYPAFVAHVVKFVERGTARRRLRGDPGRLRHRHRHRLHHDGLRRPEVRLRGRVRRGGPPVRALHPVLPVGRGKVVGYRAGGGRAGPKSPARSAGVRRPSSGFVPATGPLRLATESV